MKCSIVNGQGTREGIGPFGLQLKARSAHFFFFPLYDTFSVPLCVPRISEVLILRLSALSAGDYCAWVLPFRGRGREMATFSLRRFLSYYCLLLPRMEKRVRVRFAP